MMFGRLPEAVGAVSASVSPLSGDTGIFIQRPPVRAMLPGKAVFQAFFMEDCANAWAEA